MNIDLHRIKIGEVIRGYKDSDELGVCAYEGRLDIRPKYQREFVYNSKQRNAVIETVRKGFPLNVMYWISNAHSGFEVLDGQQRTLSICQYVNGDFSLNNQYFHNLTKEEQDQILNYELMVYFCEGTDKERLNWFEVINTAGEKLTPQELLNAVYTGPWLSDAKLKFSKSNCVAYLVANDGGALVNGTPIRQEYLETALSWINDSDVAGYMAKHQHDANADELWNYFQDVIEWARHIFPNYRPDMKGLEWGRLYNTYHITQYDREVIETNINKLYSDDSVENCKGIFEYILGGMTDTKLLNLRVFDDKTKKIAYERQTAAAQDKGTSNCSYCAIGHDANARKIWVYSDMDADHVTAWSKGGATSAENCEMLCKPHNRAKGNR